MKNIILLITDTFRYDNLASRCETMPVRTPELDRFLTERAAEVHGFHAGSFPTIPHRTDIATGRLGWPFHGWQPIDQSGPNHVASILGRAGYASQLICDCPHLFKARFDGAFTAAIHNRGQEGDRPLLHLNDPIHRAMAPEKTRQQPQISGFNLVDIHRWTNREPRYETETFPAKTGQMACRWLEENSEAGPFFLWVDFFDPHEPWDAPEYLVKRYDPDYDGPPMMHPNYGSSKAYTPAELRNLRAHYAAEAELVDRWLGRVLQKIDDLDLWETSVVAVTSDHGMSVGEHERTGKSNISEGDTRYWPIYPEISHVPFLVASADIPRGSACDILAQPMDALPTLCDLAGVNPEPPEPFHGRSFAADLRGHTAGTFRDVVVSGCCVHAAPGAVPAGASTPFVVSREWGYAPVGQHGTPELYRLDRDPLAGTDVAADHPDVVTTMHERFLAYLIAHDAPAGMLTSWGRNPRLGVDGSWALDYT